MLYYLYKFFFGRYSSPPTVSSFKLLPDEILLEILSYVSISDLFYGWLNLNCRFNILLHNLSLRKVYKEPQSLRWWERWYSWENWCEIESLQYFASQLVSLQTSKDLSPAVMNTINILDYPNLRKLTLHRPSSAQLDAIQEQNFCHLEYLSLANTKKFSFETLCKFKLLHSCEIGSIEINDKHLSLSSSIRSLILCNPNPVNLFNLLRHLPQPSSLSVCLILHAINVFGVI